MPTTSDVGANICVTRISRRNAVRPRNRNRAVKYAAGTETSSTMTVEAVATISEVFSQFRNRASESTVPKVESCQWRGGDGGGGPRAVIVWRRAARGVTPYCARD